MVTAKAVEAASSGEGELGATVAPAPASIPAPTPQDETPAQGTPPQYVTGWIFQDPATLSVAVRTNIPDPYFDHEWMVGTIDRGGHYASWDEVSGWTDKGGPV
jgi:hypothetical protein